MRGKVPTFHPPSGAVGITPAYAGKRRLCVVAAHLGRDHPRVCGEKKRKGENNGTHLGSPPRMRGKAQGALDGTETDRITPAYAGKSLFRFRLRRFLWDHPRVCGEKHDYFTSCLPSPGSPPRMRGKASEMKTLKRRLWDHPRVCGEKCLNWLIVADVAGSPPRMRGKVNAALFLVVIFGITPAYAGKRNACMPYRSCGWDHPRVCGEKL